MEIAKSFRRNVNKGTFYNDGVVWGNLKYQFYPREIDNKDTLFMFNLLNSPVVLKFLENLTEIKGLIPDPYSQVLGIIELTKGAHMVFMQSLG